MDDLVKELRDAAAWFEQSPPPSSKDMPKRPLNRMLREAAAEIERWRGIAKDVAANRQ
jgi:histone H3/H4